MVGIIDGFRWAISGGRTSLDPATLVLSMVITAVAVLVGIWYFRRMERGFADVI
jgi:lipopolysaccharide transport system permease protein